MRKQFTLFQSHIDLAHRYWREVLAEGDTVIDATCGNGHDTLFLAESSLATGLCRIYSLDLQFDAIKKAKEYIYSKLQDDVCDNIHFVQQCHAVFPKEITKHSVKLVIYNLGYLPGGDKSITTNVDSTLQSVNSAMDLLVDGGVISITCYPGHPEGEREQDALVDLLRNLDPTVWSCCHHRWCNRNKSPSLLLIQKGKC